MATDMVDTSAARLAKALRTAKKDQALRGADLADRIERLTGRRVSEQWISRRMTGRFTLIHISPDLFTMAAALELDPMDLIEDVVRNARPVKSAQEGN